MRSGVYYDQFGVRRTIYRDADDPNLFVVKTEQDVEPVLDSIARDQEIMAQNGPNRLTHRIPTVIYERLQQLGIADDPDAFRAWLNSSYGRPWKIWKGDV